MTRVLIIAACLTVILAGLKAASTLVVPFLLAAFLAILLAPPFTFMKRKGMPGSVALLAMIMGLGVLAVLAVTILRTSLDQFIASLPSYEAGLRTQLEALWAWLDKKGIEAPNEFVSEYLNPNFAMRYAGTVARALSGILGQALLIFIVVAFICWSKQAGCTERSMPFPACRKRASTPWTETSRMSAATSL